MSKPEARLEQCTDSIQNPRISLKANGISAIFLNPEKATIEKLDIDCWQKNSSTIKSDFILTKPEIVDVIIELKGKNIPHAEKQILATHELWKSVSILQKKTGALIVFSRSPLNSASLNEMKKRFIKNHKIWLELGKSGVKEYTFEMFTGAN